MSILTDEHRALIKDIKTKEVDELHEIAEKLWNEVQTYKTGNKEKCDAVIDCLQIVIIMIALKQGDYEKYLISETPAVAQA